MHSHDMTGPQEKSISKEAERKPYLDGLRGVAACMVLLGHLSIALALSLGPVGVVYNGNFGVCIFFILSGYVLAGLAHRSPLSFPAQVVRRYLRLAIPMLLTSTFAWALLVVGAYPNKAAGELLGSWWMAAWYQFAPSFTDMVWQSLYGAFAEGDATYNPNLWTMLPEFVGSVYVFIVYAVSRNRCVRTGLLLLWAGVNLTNYFPLFAAGALLYEYEGHIRSVFNRARPLSLRNLFIVALVCVAGYLGGIQDPQPGPVHWYSAMRYYGWLPQFPSDNAMHWHQFGALSLLLALLLSPFLQSLFGGAIGRYLGRISFVMYLFQIPVICSFTAGVVILMAGQSRFLVAAVAGASTIAVIFLLSSATYWLIDTNAVVLSRFSGRKFDALFPSDTARDRSQT